MEQEGPVDPNEVILRRISRHPNSYNPSLPIPVTPFAFRPNDRDIDGISFYRERFVSADRLVANSRKPASSYVVARFRAADLFALGLSLTPTPGEGDPPLPGHVVVPELSSGAYKDRSKKPLLAEMNQKLAVLASKDIVSDFKPVDPEDVIGDPDQG